MTRVVVGLCLAAALVGFGTPVSAGPILPSYSRTYDDCTTNQNQQANTGGEQRWTVSAGCDSYQNEFYERPTTYTYQVNPTAGGEIFAAAEYFQNLDIVQAKAGVDETYFYGLIDMVGLYHLTQSGGTGDLEGLKYQYEILLSREADGANGYWLGKKEGTPPSTSYGLKENEGQKDTDGDVGGAGVSITKQDSLAEEAGLDGFDTDWIDEGVLKSSGQQVLFSRLNPLDPSIIEFALNYAALGFTQAEIQAIIDGNLGYLDFRAIKGGPKDPQKYLWNDKYTMSEAGSPYRYVSGPCPDGSSSPDLSKSEFCTQGLGNIYELDTLRGTAVPDQGHTWLLLLLGTGALVLLVEVRRQ